MRPLIALVLLALPLTASAQAGTISPGMSRVQVVAALGEPVNTRSASEFTYLFYRNDCGKSCGMNDLVVLRRDSVVDAIFRSPSRHYTGTSSSPAPLPRTAARKGVRAKPAATTIAMPAKPATTAPAAAPAKPAEPLPVTKDAPAPAKPDTQPAATPRPATAPAPATPTMKPGAATDTRPWIPVNEPPVRPAPASTPSSTKPPAP